MTASRLLCVCLSAWITSACARPPVQVPDKPDPPKGHADDDHRDEPEHETLPRRVQVQPAVVAAMGIRTEPVRLRALAEVLTLPGEVTADPDRTAQITSPVPGRIEQVLLQEGVTVTAGQVVAVISVPDLGRLGGAQAAAQAKGRSARANAQRLSELASQGLAAHQEARTAQAEAESFEAEASALARQLRALGANEGGKMAPRLALRTPRSGTVLRRDAVVGTPVDTSHILATVTDLSEVWFLARVFERDLGRLRVGETAEVRLNAWPDVSLPGTVEAIGNQVDLAARTVTARIRLRNEGGLLRLGLFGIASIDTGKQEQVQRLVIPRGAVTELAGRTVVFVRQKDGDFEVHEVTLGRGALGLVEVVSGLRAGEQVVTEGAFNLKSIVLRGTLAEED